MDWLRKRYGDWALIAGAAEGIGAGFVRALALRGFHIIMVDIKRNPMNALAEEIMRTCRTEVRTVHLDLSSETAADSLMQEISAFDCRLLICVAAYSQVKPFLNNSKKDLDTYINLNNRMQVHLIHGFAGRLAGLKKNGGILLMSSLAGLLGPPLVAPYAASKAFLIRLAESLSMEFEPLGIDISVCCAGLTDTPTYRLNTPGFAQARLKPMDPIRVAEYALRQLGRKTVSIAGPRNRFPLFVLSSLLPRSISLRILSRTMNKMYG